jgi:hypothetical protein
MSPLTTTELDPALTGPGWSADQLEAALKRQRDAAAQRVSRRLKSQDRLMAALVSSAGELATAISLDFGNRPKGFTLAAKSRCVSKTSWFRNET